MLAYEANETELITDMLDNATKGSKDVLINAVYRDRRDRNAVGYKKVFQHFKCDDVLKVIDRHLTLVDSDKLTYLGSSKII